MRADRSVQEVAPACIKKTEQRNECDVAGVLRRLDVRELDDDVFHRVRNEIPKLGGVGFLHEPFVVLVYHVRGVARPCRRFG